MDELEFGPVDLILAAIPEQAPAPPVMDALADLAASGLIRVIDMVLISRDGEGAVDVSELDEVSGAFAPHELAASGLASEEDIAEMGAKLDPGTSAVLLVVELLWAKHLATRFLDSGGAVVDTVRIPAPVVNIVAATVLPNEDGQEEEVH